MRIAQMISGRGLDGTSRYCQLITRELAARGHDVTLLHRPQAWIAANVDPAAVRLAETSFARNPREVLRVRALLRALSVDVIQTHYSSANAFGMLMRWMGVRRVATGHACHLQPHWFFTDRLIAPTEAVARYHHRVNLVPRRRIAVIPNFIDPSPFTPALRARRGEVLHQLGFDADAVVVGMIGAISPRKRQEDLVRAVAKARRRAPQLRLVFAVVSSSGPGLEAVLQETGMGPYVTVQTDYPDMPRLLSALDIYGFSSGFETGPLSMLEAMAAGLPVVTTDAGAARLFVAEAETGHVVGIGDVDALARWIGDLALDPERRRRYGEAARQRVAEHFSLKAAAGRIEDVLAAAATGAR